MAVQYGQYHCNRCGRPMLHVRNTYDVPHLAHFILIVVTVGLWFPVWILHCLFNLWSSEPFRCQTCGQIAGELTARQEAAQLAATTKEWEREYGERMAASAESREQIAAGSRAAGKAVHGLFAAIARLPAWYDRALRAIAGGPENRIIYRFLWASTLVAMLAVIVLLRSFLPR